MNISGNTILITGGTSGIGRALAEALHAKGNTVIIAGRRQQLLDEITGKNPGMSGLPLDVADESSIKTFAAKIKEQSPKLNVLINNAGIARREDYTADTVDLTDAIATLQTNITSVLQLTAAVYHPHKLCPWARPALTPRKDFNFAPNPRSPLSWAASL